MLLSRDGCYRTKDRPDRSATGATIMTRFTHTTAVALVLSVPALTGAHAFNTTPYVYGQANTTINSSVRPAVPNALYTQPNTTINSSIKPFVVPNTIYSQPNKLINSTLNPVVPNSLYTRPNTIINSTLNPVVPNALYTQPNTTINSSINPYLVPYMQVTVPKGVMVTVPNQDSTFSTNYWDTLRTSGSVSGPGTGGGYLAGPGTGGGYLAGPGNGGGYLAGPGNGGGYLASSGYPIASEFRW